jgi:hypothetical protein
VTGFFSSVFVMVSSLRVEADVREARKIRQADHELKYGEALAELQQTVVCLHV